MKRRLSACYGSTTFVRLCILAVILIFALQVKAQTVDNNGPSNDSKEETATSVKPKTYYGTASYYADKFNGRQTASGEKYYHHIPSAACNVLPLGTWIRVTNLKNKRSVIVRINDRLHPRMKRIVDLNKDSAVRLGYISKGLQEVKVEVLGIKKPKNTK